MLPIAEWHKGVVHGVTVRHGEKHEEEEGEIEQEIEGQEEENAQTTMRMTMDGMEVTRHCEALSQCESVNTLYDSSTNGVQCAQCCTVNSSVCVVPFTSLVTLRSALLGMCMKLYTLFRSLFVTEICS